MIKIGITGVIGSGKSTLAKILKECGVLVIDADEISRNLTKKGTATFDRIVSVFGRNIIAQDGELDRKKLAEIIFSDPLKKRLLEDIIHPAVSCERDKILNEIEKTKPDSVVALDIPLLFETGMEKEVDYVIVAYADEKTLYSRVQKRDNMSFDEFIKRLGNQMPLSEKVKKGDFVVDTRKEIEDLKLELLEIIKKIAPAFVIKNCNFKH